MISHTTENFRKVLRKLPNSVRSQARFAYHQFRQNPHYPSLQFKCVHDVKPIYSARINVDYRALGLVTGNEIIWFWIGAHSEYDKLLKRL